MEFLVLTKVGGILGPFATVLGVIMDWLFKLTSTFGIQNIGLCIILFTLVTKILMFPLTLKQQRSSKLMSVMQPEISAVQAKYKGKTDQDSMAKQNVEIQAVYEKYGTNMTGGCVQLVIQMPILFALYQVIYQIPAYVPSVKKVFENVVNAISSVQGVDHVAQLTQFASENKINMSRVHDMATSNGMVDFLYQLNPSQWKLLQDLFPTVRDTIESNAAQIAHMNSFLGINLASTPSSLLFPSGGGFHLSAAILIPVLAGASQWFSAKLMNVNQNQKVDESNAMAQSMKTMTTVMPLMSVFFCFTFASGVGIYWIASSVFQIIQQVAVNRHLDKIDMDEMIKKNVEKANKKRAKKGLPPQRVSQNAMASLKNIQAATEKEEAEKSAKQEKAAEQVKASSDYYNKNASNPNSISSKARMVEKYNEKHSK